MFKEFQNYHQHYKRGGVLKTAKEVCKELRIPYYRLDYLIRNGLVPEPRVLANKHRIFLNEDIQRIKEKLFEMTSR